MEKNSLKLSAGDEHTHTHTLVFQWENGNNQLQPTLAILSHLKGEKKTRETSDIHSPETQAH